SRQPAEMQVFWYVTLPECCRQVAGNCRLAACAPQDSHCAIYLLSRVNRTQLQQSLSFSEADRFAGVIDFHLEFRITPFPAGLGRDRADCPLPFRTGNVDREISLAASQGDVHIAPDKQSLADRRAERARYSRVRLRPRHRFLISIGLLEGATDDE